MKAILLIIISSKSTEDQELKQLKIKMIISFLCVKKIKISLLKETHKLKIH